jgi:putative zinc finger protein
MTHLDLENLLSDYLDGLLTPEVERHFDEHLAQCGACRELIEDVRHGVEYCRSAEDLEPAPWLVSRILVATVGEGTPALRDRIWASLRPIWQPRFAYGIAMAVFSLSIIINAAGINLRRLKVEDLNPRTWVREASRNGHLFYARAEKFYYDLQVVYAIEWRLKQLRQAPEESGDQKQQTPEHPSPGGSSKNQSSMSLPEMAYERSVPIDASPFVRSEPVLLLRSTTP